jgi:hypothetical protein
VTIPKAVYTQLRRRSPEDEQSNVRNKYSILINILYINKYEFCASSWKSTKVVLRCTLNQSSRSFYCIYSFTYIVFNEKYLSPKIFYLPLLAVFQYDCELGCHVSGFVLFSCLVCLLTCTTFAFVSVYLSPTSL